MMSITPIQQMRELTIPESPHFVLIAGPCVVENEKTPHEIAAHITALVHRLGIPYIFKASYRKANRSKRSSFTGIGDEKALRILAEVGTSFSVPVVTDIHTAEEAKLAAEYVEMLQIPAFLCRQTDLLYAAGETGKWINIKKGQFMSPEAMQFAVEKVLETGNSRVLLTERGTTFGYQDLVVDMRSIPIMKQFAPVVLDCTHSLQQPNQASGVTGGRPELIETMALSGIAAGADALFIETHPRPQEALSDGANMLPLESLERLLERCQAVKEAIG